MIPKGRYLSLEKGKENFCVVSTYFIKRARAKTAKKCTKKGDARAKLLLC